MPVRNRLPRNALRRIAETDDDVDAHNDDAYIFAIAIELGVSLARESRSADVDVDDDMMITDSKSIQLF